MVHTYHWGRDGNRPRDDRQDRWGIPNARGGWGISTTNTGRNRGWGRPVAAPHVQALAAQAAAAHMTALERQARDELQATRAAVESRQLARNLPPNDLGYGGYSGAAGRLPLNDQGASSSSGIVVDFDQANRRFWEANRLSEREYREARTDEEAHAALYNQQASWTVQLYVGEQLRQRMEETVRQEDAIDWDDRESARQSRLPSRDGSPSSTDAERGNSPLR